MKISKPSMLSAWIVTLIISLFAVGASKASAQTSREPQALASINYSTLIGGDGNDNLTLSAVDASGNFYLTGSTTSTNFPVVNGFQTKLAGSSDAVIVKLDPSGKIIYSSYLGGKDEDSIRRVQLDPAGNIYLLGRTNSSDLLLKNAFQTSLKRRKLDGFFVAKVSPQGQLIYSTYLGRGGDADDLSTFVVDATGNVYLSGLTSFTTFPVQQAFQTTFGNMANAPLLEDDAFITRLDAHGNAIFSTYFGGRGSEELLPAKFDGAGNIYIAGSTDSKNLPKLNPFQKKFGGAKDGFIAKFTPQGQAVYSTFIGGSGIDEIKDFTVDTAGNVVVAGRTGSTNFPVLNAFQATSGGLDDLFVAKFNPSGQLLYSTYLGGSANELLMPAELKLTADSANNIYLTSSTNSANFPTRNAFQANYGGNGDSIVAKFDSNGQLIFSTYLGGNLAETPTQIVADSRNEVYVVGSTNSKDIPTVNALQSSFNGQNAIYVAKFDATGTAIYSTVLGGNVGQELFNFTIDQSGNAYLFGRTRSSDFPTTANAFQPVAGGGFGAFFDIFLTKLGDRGGAVYSTYLGGSQDEDESSLGQFKLDNNGNVYVYGVTKSTDFPTVNAIQPTFAGNIDGYLTKFDAAGRVVFSTFLGGSGTESSNGLMVTDSGTVYLSGTTSSIDFPVKNSLQSYGGGIQDSFFMVINP